VTCMCLESVCTAGMDAAFQTPDLSWSTTSLLDWRRRAADIAASVSQLLNTVSVCINRVHIHLKLTRDNTPDALKSTPSSQQQTNAACGTGSCGRSVGVSNSQADCDALATCSACASLRVACIRAVDSTEWAAQDVNSNLDDTSTLKSGPNCEKTVHWEGLSVHVCGQCTCTVSTSCDGTAGNGNTFGSDLKVPLASKIQEPQGGEVDDDGDCFFPCSGEAHRAMDDVQDQIHGMPPGVPVLNGTDGAGFSGRLLLGLNWASADEGGMLSCINVQLSSVGGILVPIHSSSVKTIMKVAAQAQGLAQCVCEMQKGKSVQLTAAVVQSLYPTDGIAEAAAMAGADIAGCALELRTLVC
jgi:hypothetical protein